MCYYDKILVNVAAYVILVRCVCVCVCVCGVEQTGTVPVYSTHTHI